MLLLLKPGSPNMMLCPVLLLMVSVLLMILFLLLQQYTTTKCYLQWLLLRVELLLLQHNNLPVR